MTVPPATQGAPAQNGTVEMEEEPEEQPSLIIPITSSASAREQGLFVEIFPEEIPGTPATTLMQVLKDENADSDVWSDASLLYMQQKNARDSLMLLEEAVSLPATDKDKRVRVLAATGIAHLAAAQNQSGPGNSKRSASGGGHDREDADRLFTQASKVDTFFPMTWIGRGMLNLSGGRLDQARFFFQTTLKQCGPVMPALLGMAAVMHGENDFKGAQQKYADAIRMYPSNSGASARVGFGLASYRLGQVDRAKAAFQRALTIDPECVEAMVGTALLGMAGVDENSSNFSQETEKAIKMLSMANLLDHANAMVQNHLANHYFWKWTPVTGTVEVVKGSKVVKSSQPMPLDPHERIRIGTKFETTVVEDANLNDDDSTTFRIHDAWKEATTEGLKVWKKDYDRVTALAKGAYGSTNVQEIQAESLFFLARVYHVREENDNAHKFYDKACKLAPDLTPARFGLAQTLVVKEQYDQAMEHLNTILSTFTTATDALALLGLLEVRSGKKIDEGLAHIRKAIELDPLNPQLLVLEALALQQQRTTYSDAIERYKKAIDLMTRHTREKITYDIYANSGVLCHETKKYEEALEMYKLALNALDGGLQLEPTIDNVGLDGGFIRQDDNDMFCGYVDAAIQVERAGEGRTTWKITYKGNSNSNLPLRTGDRIRIGGEFSSYILSIDESNLLFEVKDEYEAPENSENDSSPLNVFVVRENQILKIPEAITVAFNIARLHEVRGRTLAAIELHKAILKRNPAYVNSSLRLACIAVDCGSLKECGEWLKIAAATSPGNPEVLTLIGNLHLSLCDWAAAQPVFDGLLVKKVPKVEAYAALSLGNIYFANLHVSEKRYGKHLQYAADFYKGILAKDPANAYAANGIGTVLAEKGEIFKAKEVFNRVREVSDDAIADALLNLGHIYLAQKKNSEALQLYQQYLSRIEDSNTPITSKSRLDDIADVLLYISFTYFDWARHKELLNDSGAAAADGLYKNAMENLERGIERHPKKEVVLKYNLAMTKLQAANCVLQKLTRNIARTVEEVQEALYGLEESLTVVEQILDDKNENKKVPIPTSTLQNFLNHCRANITSAKSHLEDEKQRATEAEAEQEIRRLAVEAEMKEAELEEAIKKEHEAKEQEERDRKAEATMQKVAALRDNWQKEQQAVQAEKERKKKRSGAAGDMADFIEEDKPDEDGGGGHGLFDDSDESDGDIAKPVNEQSKPLPKQKELFGDSDGDSSVEAGYEDTAHSEKDDNKRQPKRKSDLFGDGDDSDTEMGVNYGKQPSPKVPDSKELFGSDEDSDDELIPESKPETEVAQKRKAAGNDKVASQAQYRQSLFGSDDDSDDEPESAMDTDTPQRKKQKLPESEQADGFLSR